MHLLVLLIRAEELAGMVVGVFAGSGTDLPTYPSYLPTCLPPASVCSHRVELYLKLQFAS